MALLLLDNAVEVIADGEIRLTLGQSEISKRLLKGLSDIPPEDEEANELRNEIQKDIIPDNRQKKV
jgi:hypothetical protein